MDDMNPNETGMVMDLEGLAKFFMDGIRVISELESDDRSVVLRVTNELEYKTRDVTLADYIQKYEELLGRKPYDSRMAHLIKMIYQPEWKQPMLFDCSDFDDAKPTLKPNMYRGEYGLFDPEPE
jgi:hypothetical protein